jgi:AcrR family transcriptional regulator
MSDQSATSTSGRRRRGESRRLLLEAARELFGRQDYRSTTTRDIADRAGVVEHLVYRYFGSKAALFREALVTPFVEVVQTFHDSWTTLEANPDEHDVATHLYGALYDLFVANHGLVITLLNAQALDPEELNEIGLDDIKQAVAVLGRIATHSSNKLGLPPDHGEIAARSTVAMIAGMAAFGTVLFDGQPPTRDEIVDEMTRMTLHGFLHRGEPPR